MTSTDTDTDPYEEFRFAPDPAVRGPEPGEWFGDPADPPLFCDGPEGENGVIAHVFRLYEDDPARPTVWLWKLAREAWPFLLPVTATSTADTAPEAMRAAEAALADYYATHRPAQAYAALTAQARHAGFAIEEAPAYPGDAGAAITEDEPRTILVSLPADDADPDDVRQPLADLACILAIERENEDMRALHEDATAASGPR